MKGQILFVLVVVNCFSWIEAAKDCERGKHNTSFEDPFNCSRYYYCDDGTLYNRQCPKPYAYNKLRSICEYNPACWGNPSPGPAENPCSDKPNGTYQPSSIQCNYFYYCYAGSSNLQVCPAGYVFNKQDLVCVRSANCL